jgi:hypothetical protein
MGLRAHTECVRACVQVGAPINRTAFRVSTSVGLYITCHGDWSCEPAVPSASPELAEPTRGAIDVLFANSSLEADVDVVPQPARTHFRAHRRRALRRSVGLLRCTIWGKL